MLFSFIKWKKVIQAYLALCKGPADLFTCQEKISRSLPESTVREIQAQINHT